VINIKGAICLLDHLDSPIAMKYKGQAVNILNRYLAGDRSMHSAVVPANPCFSFEELAHDKKTRITNIDGELYMSMTDFAMVMTDKDANQSAEVIRKIMSENSEKIQPYTKKFQFKGILYMYSIVFNA
jgi:hypothetical protein